MGNAVHIIIVSHNSANILPTCLAYLEKQTREITSCTIVDSGSRDLTYLNGLGHYRFPVAINCIDNNGFSYANNIGYKSLNLSSDDLVVFINPDTFLFSSWIEDASCFFENYKNCGVLTGKLLGYDITMQKATGRIDSTGIYRKWYGKWFDRGQGEQDKGQFERTCEVPAVCGALMACRASCLKELGDTVFDEDFFLYKEDIELSFRIRRCGWKLYYQPSLLAYHCRGWDDKRNLVDYRLRLMSAKNEVKLYCKHRSFYMAWALAKYLLVRAFRV